MLAEETCEIRDGVEANVRRIAFFGGTFDPPHHGHVAVARAAADHFSLDEVLFAPVALQPLKAAQPATSFFHRYAMTALATQSDARFVPSLLDAPESSLAPDHPNYTVNTLGRLRASLASCSAPFTLFALLGADSWLDIGRWHRAAELLGLCDWIVAARPGFSLARAAQAVASKIEVAQVGEGPERGLLLGHPGGSATRVWFLPDLAEDISATEVRSALHTGIDSGIPAVEEYIRKARLYRSE
jgi:nicotinate-nucleotide adenylyltransferase